MKESGLFMEYDNIFEGLKENKKSLIIVLILVVVIIVISILNLFFDNNQGDIDVEGIVRSFAEIYYEESYYPGVVSAFDGDYSIRLKEDEVDGIKLTLRKIVNDFEDVDASIFYQEGNYCDFLATYAIIYPKYPYSIDDYDIEVKTSCAEKLYTE